MIIATYKNFFLVNKNDEITKIRIADVTEKQFKELKATTVKFNGQGLSQKNRDKLQKLADTNKNIKFEQVSQVTPIEDLKAHYKAMINFVPKKAIAIELTKEQKAAITKVVKETNKSSVNKFIRSITIK